MLFVFKVGDTQNLRPVNICRVFVFNQINWLKNFTLILIPN